MKKFKLFARPVVVLSIAMCALLMTTILLVQAQTNSTDEALDIFLPLMLKSSTDANSDVEPDRNYETPKASNSTIIKSTTLFANALKTEWGEVDAGQPVSNLHLQDQSGGEDDWYKYVQFISEDAKYQGYRSYTLPETVAPSAITRIQLQANYRGPAREAQTWSWSAFNWSSQQWVFIGDNVNAPWWGEWTMLSFDVATVLEDGAAADFVGPNTREVRVQLQANNISDSMVLDYEAITVEFAVDETATSTPTNTPINTPTSTPTSTSTPSDVVEPVIRYSEDTTNFLNPERGFHENVSIMSTTELGWIRDVGYSLNASGIVLSDFRDGPISQAFLDRLEVGLNEARASNIKLVLRFMYNSPGQTDDYRGAQDASRDRILQHIEQLTPIFEAHSDVIAVTEAGFIGAWGEWHSSSNNLTLDTEASKADRLTILNALLDAVPQDKSVSMRNIGYLIDAYPTALTETYAYSGSRWARTGHHNDCFLANEADAGTYYPLEKKAQYQSYLDSLTPWVAMGGETCHETPDQQRTDCQTAVAEMERFHWSYIADKYYEPALTRWKNEGCFDEIAKRLGYRYRLLDSTLPNATAAGTTMRFTLRMTNDGFATIFNQRDINLVLRNQSTGAEITIALDQQDARRWLPQPGVTKSLNIEAALPSWVRAGRYDLYLALPDPKPSLANNSAYSIRLANLLNGQSIWEGETGYNALGITVEVTGQTEEQPTPASTPTPTSTLTPVPPTPVPPTPTSTPTQSGSNETFTHIEVADSMWIESGAIGSGQSWTNIHTLDQTGDADEWTKFIKFLPAGETPHYSFRSYILPENIAPEAVTSIQVQANYRGPAIERQVWTWRLYNWSTQSWVFVGDNGSAPWWGDWTMLYFDAANVGTSSEFINPSTREIRLDMQANNAIDSMDLDYEALVVSYTNKATTDPAVTDPVVTYAEDSTD